MVYASRNGSVEVAESPTSSSDNRKCPVSRGAALVYVRPRDHLHSGTFFQQDHSESNKATLPNSFTPFGTIFFHCNTQYTQIHTNTHTHVCNNNNQSKRNYTFKIQEKWKGLERFPRREWREKRSFFRRWYNSILIKIYFKIQTETIKIRLKLVTHIGRIFKKSWLKARKVLFQIIILLKNTPFRREQKLNQESYLKQKSWRILLTGSLSGSISTCLESVVFTMG